MAKVKVLGAAKRKKEEHTEDEIVWPPCIIVENARTAKTSDGRWTGLGNSEIAIILADLGHTLGKPKSSWGKDGHKGQVIVSYPSTLEGLREAERLHEHFKSFKRGRDEWLVVKSTWHGLPGHEGFQEGPDLKVFDEESKEQKRVLYGYLASVDDLDKFPRTKKKHKRCKTVSKKEIERKEVSYNTPIAV